MGGGAELVSNPGGPKPRLTSFCWSWSRNVIQNTILKEVQDHYNGIFDMFSQLSQENCQQREDSLTNYTQPWKWTKPCLSTSMIV